MSEKYTVCYSMTEAVELFVFALLCKINYAEKQIIYVDGVVHSS